MKEELRRILNLVEQKIITAEQAAELLEAMGIEEEKPSHDAPPPKRTLRIMVNSASGDTVNLKLPESVLRSGFHIGQKIARTSGSESEAMNGVDWDDLIKTANQMIDEGTTGELMNINSANGDQVKIWIE
jgi:hypothetical protein